MANTGLGSSIHQSKVDSNRRITIRFWDENGMHDVHQDFDFSSPLFFNLGTIAPSIRRTQSTTRETQVVHDNVDENNRDNGRCNGCSGY